MRIAVVHNLPFGGARRRLASQMAHLDHDVVEVCLQSSNPITAGAVVVPLRQLAPGRPRSLRPPLRYLDLVALERAWHRAGRAVGRARAEVIYLNPCHYLQAPPVLSGDLPPAVYFCDEPRRVDAEPEARATRNSLTNPLYAGMYARERRLDRRTVSRARSLLTNSRYTAREIERVYGRTATVIRMGVAEELLHCAETGARDRFLLTVGALIPAKGHDLVLRAAAASTGRPPVQVVAPRPEPEEESRLRSLAAELGVELTMRIGIDDRELANLYATAHATLYLAGREPFGLVSVEAQACGCPVIVADEGGLPETIRDGITGYQAPRDPRAVASLVDRLADPARHASMSAAAREHARTWTWAESAKQVGELLEQAGAGAPGR